MENNNNAEGKFKKTMGMICFIPAIAFFITLVYYLLLLYPLTQGHPEPKSAVGITSSHYDTLFVLLAVSSTISAAILIYCTVHLVRIKTLNTPQKMIWMLLLLAVPVSFILFWYFQVRKEPDNMPMYSGIS